MEKDENESESEGLQDFIFSLHFLLVGSFER